MIEMPCPRCDKELQFADTLYGQAIACPNCNQKIRVKPPVEEYEVDADDIVTAESLKDGRGDDDLDVSVGVAPRKLKRDRLRKKRKRRDPTGSFLADQWEYVFGLVGVFGFVLVGLVMFWMFGLLVGLIFPPMGLFIALMGAGMYTIGWWWIVFVAFRDEAMYGVLCLITNLFTYIYIFLNIEDTWRPASLLVLGFLMMVTGWGVLFIGAALLGA